LDAADAATATASDDDAATAEEEEDVPPPATNEQSQDGDGVVGEPPVTAAAAEGGALAAMMRSSALASSSALGRAVQDDRFKPTLKASGCERLKLKCDELLSNFAFKFNLRRYSLPATSSSPVGPGRHCYDKVR
jgi:hypothetical protein